MLDTLNTGTQSTPLVLKKGVIPVMLTPFKPDLSIDYDSLERLIEWYIHSGATGLFAACQSSEIFFLSDSEIQEMVSFVVKKTAGRLPVFASGHTSDCPDQQRSQLQAIADTGVDGIVLITNRLGSKNATDDEVISCIETLINSLPSHIPLGLYECPMLWKRLLSDSILQWCIKSGRFTFLKDTCCSSSILRQRLALTHHSAFNIYNAHSPTLLHSLVMGTAGYCGVMANYHCHLYVWLCQHYKEESILVNELADFLSVSSLGETVAYPVSAKYVQKKLGIFDTTLSRVVEDDAFYHNVNKEVIDHLLRWTERFSQKIMHQ